MTDNNENDTNSESLQALLDMRDEVERQNLTIKDLKKARDENMERLQKKCPHEVLVGLEGQYECVCVFCTKHFTKNPPSINILFDLSEDRFRKMVRDFVPLEKALIPAFLINQPDQDQKD